MFSKRESKPKNNALMYSNQRYPLSAKEFPKENQVALAAFPSSNF